METFLEINDGHDYVTLDLVDAKTINLSTGNDDHDTGIYLTVENAVKLANHLFALTDGEGQITNVVNPKALEQISKLKAELQECYDLQQKLNIL